MQYTAHCAVYSAVSIYSFQVYILFVFFCGTTRTQKEGKRTELCMFLTVFWPVIYKQKMQVMPIKLYWIQMSLAFLCKTRL